jgi:hypothetical protein
MKIRRTLIGLAAVAAALACSPGAAPRRAYKAEYRMSLVLGTAFPWGKGGEIWANLVKERTQGRINIKLYPGVSLIQGDQTREFTALRQGVIDMAVGSTINWSPQVKELNLFSLPFLMPDYAAIDALTQGEVGKKMFCHARTRRGVVPLAWGENGYREMTNSKRPIKHAGRPQGHEDPRGRLAALPRHLHRAGRQPDADELGRRPAGAGQRRGRRPGEPAVHLHRRQAAHRGPEERDHLGLRGRPADLRGQQGHLELLDAGRPEAIVRQAAIEAGKQEIAIARKGLVEADKPC